VSWDISGMAGWKADDFPRGAVIPDCGNSRDYVTGGWRSQRPVRDDAKCTQCLFCWIYCPDTSVLVADERVVGFNLDHCKGCGVCARQCPSDAIAMVPEGCELPEVR
jgi:pyruvate ferredoxin oxidoreductase delta subunit